LELDPAINMINRDHFRQYSYTSFPTHPTFAVHQVDVQDPSIITPLIHAALQLGDTFTPLVSKPDFSITVFSDYGSAPATAAILLPQLLITPTPNDQQRLVQRFLRSPDLTQLLQSHYISVTDKNMGLAVVSKQWAIKQCEKALYNTTNYELTHEIHTPEEAETARRDIIDRYTLALQAIDPEDPHHYDCLLPPPGTRIPLFYPVPKVHKPKPTPGRPICGAFNTITSPLSKALELVLAKIMYHWKVVAFNTGNFHCYPIVTNSDEAILNCNRELQRNPDQALQIHSYDFDSMYPNLNLDYIQEALKYAIETLGLDDNREDVVSIPRPAYPQNPFYNPTTLQPILPPFSDVQKDADGNILYLDLSLKHLPALVDLCIRHFSYLECDWIPGKVFRQIRGIAMGTNCAPPLANLTLLAAEWQWFRRTMVSIPAPPHPIFAPNSPDPNQPNQSNSNPTTQQLLQQFHPQNLSRYLDDLCVLAPRNFNLLPILSDIYGPTGLSLGPSTPSKQDFTVFLDLEMPPMQHEELHFGIYSKPGNAYTYPHFSSNIPTCIKRGFIIGEAKRFLRRNSEYLNAAIDFDRFCNILNARGYPTSFINNTISSYLLQPRELHNREPKQTPFKYSNLVLPTSLRTPPTGLPPKSLPLQTKNTTAKYYNILSYSPQLPRNLSTLLPDAKVLYYARPSLYRNLLSKKKALLPFYPSFNHPEPPPPKKPPPIPPTIIEFDLIEEDATPPSTPFYYYDSPIPVTPSDQFYTPPPSPSTLQTNPSSPYF
jgi:hypothetical protein